MLTCLVLDSPHNHSLAQTLRAAPLGRVMSTKGGCTNGNDSQIRF